MHARLGPSVPMFQMDIRPFDAHMVCMVPVSAVVPDGSGLAGPQPEMGPIRHVQVSSGNLTVCCVTDCFIHTYI